MPALFVHGVPDTHRMWDDVLAHLDRDDVLVPDLPGFGDEPGPAEPTKETYADIAQLWQTPEVGEQVMEGITQETMGPGLQALGLTPEQADVAAAGITPEMKRCILGLYRTAVHVGEEWGPALDGFSRPALALWGSGDAYVDESFAHRMAKRLGGRAVVYDCGHWWPRERPADAAAELTRFWESAR